MRMVRRRWSRFHSKVRKARNGIHDNARARDTYTAALEKGVPVLAGKLALTLLGIKSSQPKAGVVGVVEERCHVVGRPAAQLPGRDGETFRKNLLLADVAISHTQRDKKTGGNSTGCAHSRETGANNANLGGLRSLRVWLLQHHGEVLRVGRGRRQSRLVMHYEVWVTRCLLRNLDNR